MPTPQRQSKTHVDVQRDLERLEEYLDDLRALWSGDGDGTLRSKIIRATHSVRAIVREAGCMKFFTIAPPPAIGTVFPVKTLTR